MITGPVKSVQSILSGAKAPNSPRLGQTKETENKVKAQKGKPVTKMFNSGSC